MTRFKIFNVEEEGAEEDLEEFFNNNQIVRWTADGNSYGRLVYVEYVDNRGYTNDGEIPDGKSEHA